MNGACHSVSIAFLGGWDGKIIMFSFMYLHIIELVASSIECFTFIIKKVSEGTERIRRKGKFYVSCHSVPPREKLWWSVKLVLYLPILTSTPGLTPGLFLPGHWFHCDKAEPLASLQFNFILLTLAPPDPGYSQTHRRSLLLLFFPSTSKGGKN